MKEQLEQSITDTVNTLKGKGLIPEDAQPKAMVTRTKDESHGDFACNIALSLAKPCGKAPRDVAQWFVDELDAIKADANIQSMDIAGPGFINFFMDKASTTQIIDTVLEQKEAFGRSTVGAGKRVHVEFVSANPTGPLHVGHGRGAAYGSALCDVMEAAGFDVTREYYVNDAGRQMNILAASVWLRYLEACGENLTFPTNGYKGDYVHDIAAELKHAHQDAFLESSAAVFDGLPDDEPQGGDKETFIDAVIARTQELLGAEHYKTVFDAGLNAIVADIKEDLEEFGVPFQNWFSERSLVASGDIDTAIKTLQDNDIIYEQDGAQWFRTTDYGDEKDRVVIRENGVATYFASDIAYHMNKLNRGYDRIIDILGADHHGYEPRVRASIQALGGDVNKFEVLFVQFANLFRGKEKVAMSTRSGEFVTLRTLREEVGNDAARFFYVMRKCEQHMDFDLELAKSKSNENPVYYVQYAHARICSVFRQLAEQNIKHNIENGSQHLNKLDASHEVALIKTLARYPEMIEKAALAEEPHHVTYYLRDLATEFHSYYNAHKFIIDDENLRDARLNLINAAKQVFVNALNLLGLSTPEHM